MSEWTRHFPNETGIYAWRPRMETPMYIWHIMYYECGDPENPAVPGGLSNAGVAVDRRNNGIVGGFWLKLKDKDV